MLGQMGPIYRGIGKGVRSQGSARHGEGSWGHATGCPSLGWPPHWRAQNWMTSSRPAHEDDGWMPFKREAGHGLTPTPPSLPAHPGILAGGPALACRMAHGGPATTDPGQRQRLETPAPTQRYFCKGCKWRAGFAGWLLLAAAGWCWSGLLAAAGCCWLLLAAAGCSFCPAPGLLPPAGFSWFLRYRSRASARPIVCSGAHL